MNTKRNMIIVKGEIKTAEICKCQYNRNTQKWDIIYNNGKIYSYSYLNVECIKEPRILNPNMYLISRKEKKFFDIQGIYEFSSRCNVYWHICFRDGSERDYAKNELKIVESCLTDKQVSDVFDYLKKISLLSGIKNPETGKKILPERYEKIGFVGNDISLARYMGVKNVLNKKTQESTPIFPFGCNKSQYAAVKNALENQISVIQGPPGTGKTQTILNIIANILLQGKSVQIVSNNNAAIDNIYEKLASQKYNLGFIVAALGNSDNKKAFIEKQISEYPDFCSWRMDETSGVTLDSIRTNSSQLSIIFEKKKELARLKQELSQLEIELKYFKKYMNETDVSIDVLKLKKSITSRKLMQLWQECQDISENKGKIGLLFKIKSIFKYRISNWNIYKQELSKVITTFQGMFYNYKHKELCNQIDEITDFLNSSDQNLEEEMCEQSMMILKDSLAKKYMMKNIKQGFTEEDLWKNSEKVLSEYPVILSTTFSSRTSLGSSVVYDYLIIDEASQVDLATGALALSCARNVVIVGDTKQLPNIVTEDIKQQAKAIFDIYNIGEGYQFTKSFLQSVLEVMPNVTQTLLKEHYRCHPKIINFCNQKFYKGELVIMTEDKGEEDVLAVIKTVEGNHAREHYSQRQIDVIRGEVIPKYVEDKSETGIIAPYKNQVHALEKEFIDIDVATVHKFQGKEKGTIIISTVDDEITDFVDNPYLLNVAVSRAREKLVLVVSGNEQQPEKNISDLIAYIQYNNFEVFESKIYSIFDYLYKQYSDARRGYLKKHKKISEFDSENLMYVLIVDILNTNVFSSLDVVCHFPMNMLIRNPDLLNDRECNYAMNPATHIDFLIFNRISKQPVLAVEVDGYDFHKNGTVQSDRDELKNYILNLYNIPLVRFNTNGSGEKEILKNKLEGLVG